MIYHVALVTEWEVAAEAGEYAVSTRGRTLAEEGFIHASDADQWPAIRQRFYGDLPDDALLLLHIDETLLDAPVRREPPVAGSSERFPHVYGPIPTSAITATPLPAT